jgi:hypothetical protein
VVRLRLMRVAQILRLSGGEVPGLISGKPKQSTT